MPRHDDLREMMGLIDATIKVRSSLDEKLRAALSTRRATAMHRYILTGASWAGAVRAASCVPEFAARFRHRQLALNFGKGGQAS